MIICDPNKTELSVSIKVIDFDKIDLSACSGNDPDITCSSQNTAYVLYTSGSTGTPKGVEISHDALINFLLSMKNRPGFTKDDRLLSLTSTSFDISGLELYLPLISGGTLVLGGPRIATSGDVLSKYIEQEQITFMQATPSIWRLLVNSGWTGNKELKLLTGGEDISSSLAASLLSRVGQVWNMYGPTETTIWSTCAQLFFNSSEAVDISIGKPIDNTQVLILNDRLEAVPVGVIGQIYIGGAGLAKRYINQQKLTQKSFIINPFFNKGSAFSKSEYLYSTGDLAKYSKSGDILFLGRRDSQVKLNGLRIEPAEIEFFLTNHSMIKDCLVIVNKNNDTGSTHDLVAYYTLNKNSQIKLSVTELRSYLLKNIPAYMIPNIFVEIESFPMTISGKIDRKKLPEPKKGRQDIENECVLPSNDFEQVVVSTLKHMLNIEVVGVTDNFFELGATSLDIVKLAEKLSEKFERTFSPIDLFTYSSVLSLSEYFNLTSSKKTKDINHVNRKEQAKNRLKKRIKRKS